jgi:hypothetical protein
MSSSGELAKSNMGNVYRCVHGVVHINCHGVSFHFREDAFLSFATMIKEASSKLMDETISGLLEKEE